METKLNSKSKSEKEWPAPTSDPKHDYVYKVAVVGTRYKLFTGWVSTTDHSIGETSLFPEVMVQTVENHPDVEMMLGDGVFGNRPMCKRVGSYALTLRALPHRNCTLKRKGVKEWVMLWALSKDPDIGSLITTCAPSQRRDSRC